MATLRTKTTTGGGTPGLFGIVNSNKDFTQEESWGKNQFNNAFPAALLNYLDSKDVNPIYIKLNKDLSIAHEKISVKDLYKTDPRASDTFFAFEEAFRPYEKFVQGTLPRVDLVIEKRNQGEKTYLAALEIKLTALPDDQTCALPEEEFGSEIVVRPDTIVYLALSFASATVDPSVFSSYLSAIFLRKMNWKDETAVKPMVPTLVEAMNRLMTEHPELEVPLMVQPVWKTKGKSTALAENCLDVFVWSNFALTRLFFNQVGQNGHVTRPERTVVWLAMMLNEIASKGEMRHKSIIDDFTYNTRNDKAFSIGGLTTREYMRSPELIKPRITREEIKKIILNGGEKLLSPERRFDGIVQGTVDLF